MEKLYRHVFINGLPLDPPSEPDPQPKPGYMASLRSPEMDLVNAALDLLEEYENGDNNPAMRLASMVLRYFDKSAQTIDDLPF